MRLAMCVAGLIEYGGLACVACGGNIALNGLLSTDAGTSGDAGGVTQTPSMPVSNDDSHEGGGIEGAASGSTCGSPNCGGCCDSDGVCKSGAESQACGMGGDACEGCTNTSEICSAGRCVSPPPPACGPHTCDGCCNNQGACVGGQDSAACGSAGGTCQTCVGDSVSCVGGQCAWVCGPNNCNGCCDTLGSCVGGQSANACGSDGNACVDCVATGNTCAGAQCVPLVDSGPPPTCDLTACADTCVKEPTTVPCCLPDGTCGCELMLSEAGVCGPDLGP